MDGMVVFTPGTFPGDQAEIEIIQQKKRFAMGRLIRLIKPSADRIEPDCAAVGTCGGCGLLGLSYEAQLRLKRRQVDEALRRIGGIEGLEAEPVIGMEQPSGYRNKADFHLDRPTGATVAGFFEAGSHVVAESSQCSLVPKQWSPMIKTICDLLDQIEFVTLKPDTVTLRQSNAGGETMLIFHTETVEAGDPWPDFAARLTGPAGPAQSVYLVVEDELCQLSGADRITERIHGLDFLISPTSFFQVNTKMAEYLVDSVLKYAGDLAGKRVFDLYCGIGTFTLPLAKAGAQVIGLEENETAVMDARENAERNGIESASFQTGRVEDALPILLKQLGLPHVVVVDPPRAGLSGQVVEAIIKAAPERIVYVSCDSGTLARDLARFCEGGYRVAKVQPVDMFPHTPHVETVVLMSRIEQ